jgi:hypothetical protein
LQNDLGPVQGSQKKDVHVFPGWEFDDVFPPQFPGLKKTSAVVWRGLIQNNKRVRIPELDDWIFLHLKPYTLWL